MTDKIKKIMKKKSREFADIYCKNSDSLDHLWNPRQSDIINMMVHEFTGIEAEKKATIQGHDEGYKYGLYNIIYNALEKGVSIELIKEISGFEMEKIDFIQKGEFL